MPSNTKGGKGYKKKKKGANTYEPVFIDRQMGQMPARAIRLLGNRNVICYSNDNVLRMCHICGKMKGRVFIEPGDVVLITLRDFKENPTEKELKAIKVGDIVGKYDPLQYKSLKEEDGVNPKLFMKLESAGYTVEGIGTDYKDVAPPLEVDDAFEFEHSESESEEEGEERPVKTEEKRQTVVTRASEEDELNIDDI